MKERQGCGAGELDWDIVKDNIITLGLDDDRLVFCSF